MKHHTAIPQDWPVRPILPHDKATDRVTDGYCGLSWDDAVITSMTPAPAARCPFEPFHVYRAAPRRSFAFRQERLPGFDE